MVMDFQADIRGVVIDRVRWVIQRRLSLDVNLTDDKVTRVCCSTIKIQRTPRMAVAAH